MNPVTTTPGPSPQKHAKISRRTFLATSAAAGGALVVGLTLRGRFHLGHSAHPEADPFNAWIRIHPDGQTQLVLNKSEMGQGVFTSLPMILAEEAEIDFSTITVVQADNADGTGGSGSVWESYQPLRRAGAQVREVLIAAAARQWRVPAGECRARSSQVTHTSSGRIRSYSALIKDARRLPLPDPGTVPLKDPKDFTLIGRSIPHLDIPDKVKGTARFGLDVRLPGMVYAVVAQCPYFRGDLLRFDAAKAKATPGVLDVFEIPTDPVTANKDTRELAVVATNTWAAMQGRKALVIEWKPGQFHDESTESITRQLSDSLDAQEVWNSTNTSLNPDTVAAAKRIEAVYEFPFLAHANLEPMNITVHLDGGRCEIWSPTQDGENTQEKAAEVLGIGQSNVTVHVTFMGGGFGRRFGWPFDHQALRIAEHIRRPIQLVWTREDDFTHDKYRAASMHRLRGGVDLEGNLVAWSHRISDTTAIRPYDPTQGAPGVDAAIDHPYPAQHFRISYVPVPSGFTRGAWRGVDIESNLLAVECFIDELARLAGQDPYLFRRRLLEKAAVNPAAPRSNFDHRRLADPRHMIQLLDLVTGKAGWSRPLGPHRGRGISCFFSKTTYLAQVAEVTVNDGNLRVDRVVTVVDPGRVINMNGIRAQIEGAILMGLSAALKERVTVRNGSIQQQNFDDYDLLRIPEAPLLETHLIEGGRPPGGIGEPPLALIGPSVGNAIFAATGKRLRKLPFQLDEPET